MKVTLNPSLTLLSSKTFRPAKAKSGDFRPCYLATISCSMGFPAWLKNALAGSVAPARTTTTRATWDGRDSSNSYQAVGITGAGHGHPQGLTASEFAAGPKARPTRDITPKIVDPGSPKRLGVVHQRCATVDGGTTDRYGWLGDAGIWWGMAGWLTPWCCNTCAFPTSPYLDTTKNWTVFGSNHPFHPCLSSLSSAQLSSSS